jgi:hypothetical protein
MDGQTNRKITQRSMIEFFFEKFSTLSTSEYSIYFRYKYTVKITIIAIGTGKF